MYRVVFISCTYKVFCPSHAVMYRSLHTLMRARCSAPHSTSAPTSAPLPRGPPEPTASRRQTEQIGEELFIQRRQSVSNLFRGSAVASVVLIKYTQNPPVKGKQKNKQKKKGGILLVKERERGKKEKLNPRPKILNDVQRLECLFSIFHDCGVPLSCSRASDSAWPGGFGVDY